MTDETTTEKEICPECGQDLSDRDPEGHSVGHYGERAVDPTRGKDTAARQRQLLDMAQRRRDAEPRKGVS